MMSSKADRIYRRQRSQPHFTSQSYLANVASQFCPTVSIDDQSQINDDSEFVKFEDQVAGHQFEKEKDTIGLLKCKNGTILKPVGKPEIGLREIRFYEQLQTTSEPIMMELKDYTPQFHGTRVLDINGKKVDFLILENLMEGFAEPCIMDIKIGKRTWDPIASDKKIKNELGKYALCKNDVGFSIPGFQVHKLSTGRLHKYNKEYGKKLNGSTVMDALKIFLNADTGGNVNRELLMQLLTVLWKIQKWARIQNKIELYSSSLLLIYDFKVLKNLLNVEPSVSSHPTSLRNITQRKTSFKSPEGYCGNGTGCFSGQISPTGPILHSPSFIAKPIQQGPPSTNVPQDARNSWHEAYNKIRRSHSFHINYNDYLAKIKQDYASTLQELNGGIYKRNNNWCTVKMIDFAHVFPSETQTPDTNYMEGIDNIVNIFEKFLYSWR